MPEAPRPAPAPAGKHVVGYCDRWSLRAGEVVTVHAASHLPTQADLDLVRLGSGHRRRFSETVVAEIAPRQVTLDDHLVPAGSFASVDLGGDPIAAVGVHLWPTGTDGDVLSVDGHVTVLLSRGRPCLAVDGAIVARGVPPLELRRWYALVLTIGDEMVLAVRPCARRSGPADPGPAAAGCTAPPPRAALRGRQIRFAGGGFDGRMARPWVRAGSRIERWRMADLDLHQLPDTGVTGPGWDGTAFDPASAPAHYDAVHFHRDDLYDAGWPVTAEIRLPADLPSGIYCARLRSPAGDDRIPLFVRPAAGRPHAPVAFLVPTATYLAYANHRMAIAGSDFFAPRPRLGAEQQYLVDHPEVGLSQYEYHPDGSGVVYSSRLRPVLNVRPGADGWGFTPDTDILAFLNGALPAVDVLGDEDLHAEGTAALHPYRVLVTGSHPEYWSTAMLDGLEQWMLEGGRLVYLGGNGLYWRVAFSDRWPAAMEVRRAEDGTRAWVAAPGEAHHAFGGEYGGLWRRLGRPPNRAVGVGFAAQGFDRATCFVRTAHSRDERAAWIFAGVPGDVEVIGDFGVGGGAAGQEVDRHDVALGSPPHALVVASATGFSEQMLRTKEEFHATVLPPHPDPMVRADMVFFETPAGGAVFSVGSIAWWGALAEGGEGNPVARITANVLHRFADPAPFTMPA